MLGGILMFFGWSLFYRWFTFEVHLWKLWQRENMIIMEYQINMTRNRWVRMKKIFFLIFFFQYEFLKSLSRNYDNWK